MNDYIGENIKAVLFDHDDTLVGTIGPKWEQHKYVARTFYGKTITDSQLMLHWGKPLGELVCSLYGTENAEQALSNNYTCYEQYPKVLFPCTIPALLHIRRMGKLTGIVTATTRFSLEYDFDMYQILREMIDYIQTAEDTSYHKPDPRVFDLARSWLAEREIMPEQVLYVADGIHDMRAAVGADFNFLGVETGLVDAAEFRKAGASSIPSLASLILDST
jgi:phosphoglycolate phosphatase-like HAD superfamily hydrolase